MPILGDDDVAWLVDHLNVRRTPYCRAISDKSARTSPRLSRKSGLAQQDSIPSLPCQDYFSWLRQVSLVLHKLRPLDTSSFDFDDQFRNSLHGEEHVKCLPSLEGDGLVWLVNYITG